MGRNFLRVNGILELAGRPFLNHIIVVERGGRVVYFQLRRLDDHEPRYLNPDSSLKRVLFGLETLERDVPCGFITEGNLDALPIWDRGGAAVAITGSYVPELPLLIGTFARTKKVAIIATDWDPDPKKGERVASELLGAFRMAGLAAVRLPKVAGCKDLGDWARTYPLASWRELYGSCGAIVT